MLKDTEIIRSVFDKVRGAMVYESDKRVFGKSEWWKSWSEEVKSEEKGLRDDCDGFALTLAEMLVEAGIPKENVAIVFCIAFSGTEWEGGHLVTKVYDRAKENWFIVDNVVPSPTLRDVCHNSPSYKYEWISCMYANKPGKWENETA